MLHLYGSRGGFSASADSGEVRGWLEAMLALATEMEALPPPRVTTAPSDVTAQSRQDTSRFLTPAVAAVMLGLPPRAIVAVEVPLLLASSWQARHVQGPSCASGRPRHASRDPLRRRQFGL